MLAAGVSSRFGASKQLQPYQGEPLVRRAVRLAEECCGSLSILVTGSHWQEVLRAGGPLRGFFVRNERYESGMASSIAAGVNAVRDSADGVLLLLADQPLVSTAHLAAMQECWRNAPDNIVASAYAGTIGPPVIFPRSCFAELQSLAGDCGARAVIENNSSLLTSIAFEDAAADVDTPDDLARLNRR